MHSGVLEYAISKDWGRWMGQIEKKTAVITGAETEIGREIARRFFDEGANIILAGTDEGALKEICSQIDPTFQSIAPNRMVNCWLYQEIPDKKPQAEGSAQ